MAKRVGIMLDLVWQYRRHVDVFAGTQRYAEEQGNWQCEVDEYIDVSLDGRGRRRKYNGIVARATPEVARRAKTAGIPLVNVWYASKVRDQLPGVFPDYEEVGRLAAEHLLSRGFRSFACIYSSPQNADGIMSSSFKRITDEAGCPCNSVRVSRSFSRTRESWKRFQTVLEEWIQGWSLPIAIFVALSDITARYVVHAVQRHGLRVPQEVALITPTNELSVGLVPPPALTSVEINYEQIGFKAAELLDGLMRGKKAPSKPITIQPTGIIARTSTDFFAVDDEVVASAMQYIEQNVTKRITVGAVAEAVGVSRRTLERRFSDSVDRQVSVEIRRLRLEKAQRLLTETDLLVKQIASQTGFGSSIRMNEVFLRELGVTPSEFRNSMR